MPTINAEPGQKGFIKKPVPDRFWSKVIILGEEECWPWKGAHDNNGRGQFWLEGRRHRSPRIAWSLHNGVPFPDHLHACHSCDNPACCNPKHIWPGTRSENFLDAARKGRLNFQRSTPRANRNLGKTHCIRGHEFTAENTVVKSSGKRSCRECAKIHRAKYDALHRSRATLSPETDGGQDG